MITGARHPAPALRGPGAGTRRRATRPVPPEPIRSELFGPDRLGAHARALAHRHEVALPGLLSRWSATRRGPFIAHLDAAAVELRAAYDALVAASARGIQSSAAGAWLLDNYIIILAQSGDIRAALPRGYYAELPKLANGERAGYPRIYDIAFELIAHTDGRLDAGMVELMLGEYQSVSPLTMGELWAVPAMLRLGCLENVRRMAARARRDAEDAGDADLWVDRFAHAAAESDRDLAVLLDEFVTAGPTLSAVFITRFLPPMRSRRADFTPLRWLEQWIAEDGMSVDDAVQWSTQHQALTQHVMANSIVSLRAVGELDWRALFERQSVCEAVLRTDPDGTYPEMTFETRDRYRHVVERLARFSARGEAEVAGDAIALAAAATDRSAPAHERHVGYYLVGEGNPALRRSIQRTPSWLDRAQRVLQRHPGRLYFTAVAAASIGVLDLLLAPWGSAPRGDMFAFAAAVLLAAIPATDVALAAINQAVTFLVPPTRLPQLDFRDGVPVASRTIVVVPLLLGSTIAVQEALDHLETQHLANRDPEVRFALLSDFTDAPQEARAGDGAIVTAVVEGVRALNAAHALSRAGDGVAWSPFYVFHRPRRWNAADATWMGWERKRGKLAQFNEYLRGAGAAAFAAVEGDLPWLGAARYVITLDADTVLPRDGASSLIGTIAHPLNRAVFDDARNVVVRGYGILQPRVSISLQSANVSAFASIFAGHPGVDPYTTAVSDVYQDLFHEGTFTGKGIYDVDVFRRATEGRFPENAVLSHDLIEGAFARAGLVTNVEVFDDYPATYELSLRRQHRWVRGDWQLLPWLAPRVPGAAGRTANPLSRISRWKIADNLRRSLSPIVILAWLAAAWTVLPGAPLRWTLVALGALVAPWIFAPLVAALRGPRGNAWLPYYSSVGRDALSSAAQAALGILLLPYHAAITADAVTRTLFRVGLSRRKLLQWRTAAQVEHASRGSSGGFLRLVAPGALLALGLAAVAASGAARAYWRTAAFAEWAGLTLLSILWLAAPAFALRLSAPVPHTDLSLAGDERAAATRYARAHWNFFERFIGDDSQWLVPDNFQETPVPIAATRTSPTNIGLQLLATMSARDLGCISRDRMCEMLERAFDSLDRMGRCRGHFYNWYDLADLRVLEPPYVSTVDSGNLAGHLVALAQGCDGMVAETGVPAAERRRLATLADRARTFAMAMDFTMLYDPERRLFAIGYDERSGTLDGSRYDLLASEARLASYVAIAKGDVPTEHWFRLGRSLTRMESGTALISWSGSMFEYLMPLLVMPSRPSSLLDQSVRSAVRRHAALGRARRMPWGMSESAYNGRDRHETYQYRAFGVSDLALKRGLDADAVVAPYASLLALAVDPHRALTNLAVLERLGAFGDLGFVEALDYSRPDPGAAFALVRTHMAHHVGMSLVALDNALHLERGSGIWQRRFMADPNMRAAALLLDERVPRLYVARPTQPTVRAAGTGQRPAPRAAVRRFDTAATSEPRVGLLGGRAYSVLVTNAGGGYSRAGDIAVNRWRDDATRDDRGSWIYVRDVAADRVWSVAHQPTGVIGEAYSANFAADRITFTRRDHGIETRTEVAVVPREQTETRRVTLTNRTRAVRELDVTSCFELVLGDPEADRAHQAFQNLFVETEWIPERSVVIASRRPRAATERHPWCGHVVAAGAERVGEVTCETDRARFLGRGRDARRPRALDAGVELSGTAGGVLDPVMALRVRVRLAPGRSTTIAFTTVIGDSRDEIVRIADRHRDLSGAERSFKLAAIETEVELEDLSITSAEAQLYQDLAGALIYPDDTLREPPGAACTNARGQQALWAHGISGDHPILLATIRGAAGLPSVRQLLTAHHFWRMKGIACDLVVLNTDAPSYLHDLHEQLVAMVEGSSEGGVRDRPGGVMVRRSDAIPEDDAALLRSTARVHVECDGVGLGEIIAAAGLHRIKPPRRPADIAAPPQRITSTRAARSVPLPPNGLGAMDANGDYRIRVAGARVPPAPWCNIIANSNGGFCVSERGGGFAFTENSYLFRLTPWRNDPVSDPFGEVLYLQDLASGTSWTPTPGPAAAIDGASSSGEFEVTHAPGATTFTHEHQGIASELVMGVPEVDPVKISRLRLTNRSDVERTLRLTTYVEWVLGSRREQTQHHIHTERDEATGAIFARNRYTTDFADRVAFSWISETVTDWTADRHEFIGRNGDLVAPAALQASALSGRAGSGYDPCATMRATVVLAPGETRDVVVLLGAASGAEEARAVIGRNTAGGAAIARACAAWERRLATITVRTPDPEFDAMANRWWLYQTLVCRLWARSALSQSSGAFGFRDQLQDSMAIVYAEPAVARGHILRAAGRQFPEGDVQHWWHEPGGRGVRTRISDDLAWLPFAADHYVRITGDRAVWDERTPFLAMRTLEPWEHEAYDQPAVGPDSATLYEHCVRALDRACTSGAHGLPLIGGGDWNDGMNRVGAGGAGETVWLAWFLVATLRRFAWHALSRGDSITAQRMRATADAYVEAAEREGWDGDWYRRAYFDDGTPLGSASNDACAIDSVAQSWAVLSGGGSQLRSQQAMVSVTERLVHEETRLIAVLSPPFDHSSPDPGYVMGYLPGVRENGAQYTHAAVWVVMAFAHLGDGARAFRYLQMLNPLTRTRDAEGVATYMVEPYVSCADVYTLAGHVGRGGWTWYTGAAGLSYRAAIEEVAGFRREGGELTIDPCIPPTWSAFDLRYRHGGATYEIQVKNPDGLSRGVIAVRADGALMRDGIVRLTDDGATHHVVVTMGAAPG